MTRSDVAKKLYITLGTQEQIMLKMADWLETEGVSDNEKVLILNDLESYPEYKPTKGGN